MPKPAEPECRSCKFLLATLQRPGAPIPTTGTCRRYPPVNGGSAGFTFPEVPLGSWCGEYVKP